MTDWFTKRTLGSLPDDAATRWGDSEALVFKGRRWTHHEFAAEVDKAAKALIAIGVVPGEKVSLWMNNKPEWLFLMYAVTKVGAVLVPLNTRYRREDIRYVLTQSTTGTLIADDRSGPVNYLAMINDVLPATTSGLSTELELEGFPDLRRIVFVGSEKLPGTLSYETILHMGTRVTDLELANRTKAVDPDAVALICYTSGTTGDPKGVMHSHINIRNCIERAQLMGITFNDIEINYLPLFHLYGLCEVAMLSIVSGAKQILMDVFNAQEALELIEQERVTLAHGFDTHWSDLLTEQAIRLRDVSSLRLGTLPAGTEATTPTAEAVQDVFCPTVSGFGMTEIWAFISVSSPSDSRERRIYASGYPMADIEFRIRDPETGTLLPRGKSGELIVKGYTVMQGYYNKPQETEDSFTGDGWFLTGDRAQIRPDGHLVFIGRYKDMLKVGGENVAPAEVEARLLDIPGVNAVAVVAYPDPRLHEVGVAFIVPSADAVLSEEGVLDHLRGKIASFKIPRHVLFVEDFPMTSSGKVQKVKLRSQALDMIGTQAESA